jgi:acetylornithine deacetylase/succinyl-diaminopimelate desuccinylase-like protein
MVWHGKGGNGQDRRKNPDAALADPLLAEVTALRGIRECLQFFTREKQWINDIHLQVCRIPAPTFAEAERAQWVAAQLRAYGWDVSLDRAGNVIAAYEPGGRGPLVALTAHLDTVIAPRHKDEIVLGSDGKMRGPGVADNGAGLAALLAIARGLKSCPRLEGMHSGLLLVANVGEEGEGNLSGMRYLCRQSPLARRIRSFVVLDGAATDHITSKGLGSRRFEITFTGPGGHSWSDYGAGNPVHALSRAIAWFTAARLNGSPKSSLNVGVIEGGASINSIPPLARAKVDIRSESNDKLEDLVESLQSSVERAQEAENQLATGGKVSAKIREIGARPAAALPDDASMLHYLRAVDAHLGIRSHLDCASTDANIPLSLGIPAVSIGGGGHGGGAHTLQEWFSPDGRDLGLKRVLLTLALLLREEQDGEL